MLTNTIYFIAAWAVEFNENNTQDGAFTLADGTAVNPPLMRGKGGHPPQTRGAKAPTMTAADGTAAQAELDNGGVQYPGRLVQRWSDVGSTAESARLSRGTGAKGGDNSDSVPASISASVSVSTSASVSVSTSAKAGWN